MEHHNVVPVERLLTQREVLAVVPFTRVYILRLEKQGRFPQRLRFSEGGKVFWRQSDIEAWMANLSRGPGRSNAVGFQKKGG